MVLLLVLLAGALGLTLVCKGVRLGTKKGEWGESIGYILGGAVLATPLGVVLWAVLQFSLHPISFG